MSGARLRELDRALAQDIDRQIDRERLRALLGSGYGGAVGNVVAAVGLYAVMRQHLRLPGLAVWACAHSLLALARILLCARWRGRIEQLASPRWCSTVLAVHSTLGSVSWALMFNLFIDSRSPLIVGYVTMTLYCVLIAAQSTTGAYLPGYVACVLVLAAGMLVKFVHVGGAFAAVAGGSTMVLTAILLSNGRRAHRTWVTALRASKINQALTIRLEEENARAVAARKEAEGAVRAKMRFFAAASHDLRQPLHAQALFIGALDRLGAGPDVARLTERIAASHQAMQALLDGLLDISKLDAGVVRPAPRAFAVQQLFDQLRTELADAAAHKGLALRIVDSSAFVVSDPLLVGRVLRNLVSNAIRYTERGRVVVGVKRAGARLRLLVADSGVGIPPDQREAVFDEFVQLHNPERDRAHGIGLGLAIVRRLVHLLGAELSLRSEVGRGTTFSLALDAAEAPAAPLLDERAPSSPPRALEQRLAGQRILIVDDELLVLEAMQSYLESIACTVHAATSSDEALALVEAGVPIDAVIVDHRLTGQERGTRVVERLRAALGRELPAVIITGDTAPDRLREATAFGLPLLHKPVRTRLLVETLVALLPPQRTETTRSA